MDSTRRPPEDQADNEKEETMLRLLTAAVAAAVLVVPAAQADRLSAKHSGPGQPNAVTEWNAIATPAIAAGRPPASSEVLLGLVQAAIYDAVLSAKGDDDDAFIVSIRRSGPTSADAAVAAAARGVLMARVPGQAAVVETAYTSYLAGIADGSAKTNGIRLGRGIAGAYVGLRLDDGFDNVVLFEQPQVGPGVFEPLVPLPVQPVDVKLKQVRPLTFDDPARFRPDGPDPLTSQSYTEDFNEVKALGRSDSAVRTPEQTTVARFWTDHAMSQWSRAVRNLALARRLDLEETAELMALAHVSGGDSAIGCWEAKYYFNFWRPVHAIQRAGTDGNPDTEADSSWTHLVAGNHPEYPSGHACVTGGVTHGIADYFGTDRVAVDIDSVVTGTTQQFDRLRDVRAEVKLARIFGGLHFRKAMEDGEQIGRRTARQVGRSFD
jgi:hypothetical protein